MHNPSSLSAEFAPDFTKAQHDAPYNASYSAVVMVRGVAAAEFFNDQLSVTLPAPAQARFGLMLNSQGRIISDGLVLCYDAQHYLWCVDPTRLTTTTAALAAKLGADHAQVSISVADTLYSGTAITPLEGAWNILDPRDHRLGYRVISQTPIAPDMEYLDRRLALGLPETADLPAAKALPAEYGLDQLAIDFTKGCFIGQEVCARLKHQGKRKFTVIPVNFTKKNMILQPGQELFLANAPVAQVISVYDFSLAFIRLKIENISHIEQFSDRPESLRGNMQACVNISQQQWRHGV